MTQKYPSVLLENAVNEFSKLPGIGRKTALRLVLHLLKRTPMEVENFGNSFILLRNGIRYCSICHNICDEETCHICSNPSRDTSTVCVVENIKEVLAIENTGQFKGLYHVLGGIISPMDGIGPNDLEIGSLVERVKSGEVKEVILALSTTMDLEIGSLVERVKSGEVKEVILALSTTMEGDTTNYYIYRKIAEFKIKVSTIARGVSIGDEIEYADEVTLGRSIVNRTEFSF